MGKGGREAGAGKEVAPDKAKIDELLKRWEAVLRANPGIEAEAVTRMNLEFTLIGKIKNDKKRTKKIAELEAEIAQFEGVPSSKVPAVDNQDTLTVNTSLQTPHAQSQQLPEDVDADLVSGTAIDDYEEFSEDADEPPPEEKKDWGQPDLRTITLEDAEKEIDWAKKYPELETAIKGDLNQENERVFYGAYFRAYHEKGVTVFEDGLDGIASAEAVWAENEYESQVSEKKYTDLKKYALDNNINLAVDFPDVFARLEAARDALADAIELSTGEFRAANDVFLEILNELNASVDLFITEKIRIAEAEAEEQEKRKNFYDTVQQARAEFRSNFERYDIDPQEFFPVEDERAVNAIQHFEHVKDDEISIVEAAYTACLLAFSELHSALQEYIQSPNAASADLEKPITFAEAEQAIQWAKDEFARTKGKFGLPPQREPKSAKDTFEWGAYWRTQREGKGQMSQKELDEAAERNGECARRVFVERQFNVWFEALCKKAERAGVLNTLFDRYVKNDPAAGKVACKEKMLGPLETIERIAAYDEAHKNDANAKPFDLLSPAAQKEYRNRVLRAEGELTKLDREIGSLIKEKMWADPNNPDRAQLIAALAPEIAQHDAENALPLSQMATAADTYGFSPEARLAIQNVLTAWEGEHAAIIKKLAKLEEMQSDPRIPPAKVKSMCEAIVRQSAALSEKIQKGMEEYVVPELTKQTQAEIAALLALETVQAGIGSQKIIQEEQRVSAELSKARIALETALADFLTVPDARGQFLAAHQKYHEAATRVRYFQESVQPIRDAAKISEQYRAVSDTYSSAQQYLHYFSNELKMQLPNLSAECNDLERRLEVLAKKPEALALGEIAPAKDSVELFKQKVVAFKKMLEQATAEIPAAEKLRQEKKDTAFKDEMREEFIRFQDLRRRYESLKQDIDPKNNADLLRLFRSEIALRDEFSAKLKAAGNTNGLEQYKIAYKNEADRMDAALNYFSHSRLWKIVQSHHDVPQSARERIEYNLDLLHSFYISGSTSRNDLSEKARLIFDEINELEIKLPPKKSPTLREVVRGIGKKLFDKIKRP